MADKRLIDASGSRVQATPNAASSSHTTSSSNAPAEPKRQATGPTRDPNYYPPVVQSYASDKAPLKLAGSFLAALIVLVLLELALH